MHKKSNQLESIDQLLRRGNVQRARSAFKSLNLKSIKKNDQAMAARLSWRLGLANYGLKILGPLVKEKTFLQSSPEEVAEYSACLNALGGNEEAESRIIEYLKVNPKLHSNAWIKLNLAYIKISRWDYQGAYDLLVEILAEGENSVLPAYTRQVASVNFLAALISTERWEEAEVLFNELVNRFKEPEFQRLASNLAELKLQILIGKNQIEEAERSLCAVDVKTLEGPELVYYLKWKLIINLQAKKELKIKDYQDLRALCVEARHFEVVRDLDARFAIKNGSEVFIKRVLYATPWSAYRMRTLKAFKKIVKLDKYFRYKLWPDGNDDSKARTSVAKDNWSLELKTAEFKFNGKLVLQFKKGGTSHRLLRALAEDLYRPHSIGSLFSRIFPGEYYNPVSSPSRVHQAVRKTRALMEEMEIPLQIESFKYTFRLVAVEVFELELLRDLTAGKALDWIEELHQEMGDHPFDVLDAATKMNLHPKTIQRQLKKALGEGLVKVTGRGRATKYYFET